MRAGRRRAGWRDSVAEALDDPSVQARVLDPGAGQYRDEAGGEVGRETERSGRRWTEIERDGLRVAALETDEALAENPELVEAASSATLLAVETGRLEGELRIPGQSPRRSGRRAASDRP